MDHREAEFLKRLEAVFKLEAEEHIQSISSLLITLENSPEAQKSTELIETIFREAHSLKGASRSVNRTDIESICRVLENIFSMVKNNQFVLNPSHFDLIQKAMQHISTLISDVGSVESRTQEELIDHLQTIIETEHKNKFNVESDIAIHNLLEIKDRINPEPVKKSIKKPTETVKKSNTKLKGATPPVYKKLIEKAPADKSLFQSETVRIETSKLDPLFLQAEQLIQSKMAAIQRSSEANEALNFIRSWKSELRNRISQNQTVTSIDDSGITDWNFKKQNELERQLNRLLHNMDNDQRSLARMIDEHLDSMKTILMLPVSTLVAGFPNLVRDLARTQGKEVELKMTGQEIEVDKRILQELKDPMIHLLRNCMDHGIQTPDERQKLKKPSMGIIQIDFLTTDGRNLEIKISDDGSGINKEKVIESAIKSGVLSPQEVQKLSVQEVMALIFNSGITTSPLITDISGRGLGLAIVNEKVDSLNGTITVDSKQNQGTTFKLKLPLTLSTLRGVLIKSEEQLFMVPNIHVKHALRVHKNDIKTVKNRDTIHVNQDIISVVRLSHILGLKEKNNALNNKNSWRTTDSFQHILVLFNANRQMGFLVDEVLDEHQILIKELGRQLTKVKNISGATVLGSGEVVPVINVSDLIKSASNAGKTSLFKAESKPVEKIFKILVTEDSITSRTLIKDILESAGYIVETAIDGVDGYTKALIGGFDLIVSDIDMPRMNGFELTAKIRQDKNLSELPVVLVTALDTREDREHGIDVGANAYIIKSSFDQSNLLEVIKKLL